MRLYPAIAQTKHVGEEGEINLACQNSFSKEEKRVDLSLKKRNA